MMSLFSFTILSFFCFVHSTAKDGFAAKTKHMDLGQFGYFGHRVRRHADGQWSEVASTTLRTKKVAKNSSLLLSKRYSDNQWTVLNSYEPNLQRQPVYYKTNSPVVPLHDFYTVNAQHAAPLTTQPPLEAVQQTPSPTYNYIALTEAPLAQVNAYGLPQSSEKFNYEMYYDAPLQRLWFGNQNPQKQQGILSSPILPIAIIIIIVIFIISIITAPLSTTVVPVRRSMARRNDDIDWSALNILDYISMMEEVWRKFDVKDMECQKRLICEIHQNEEDFGGVASNVVSLFKYLRYLTLVKLPGDMQNTFADYLHAADQGRDAKNDCSKVFDTCDFSVKDTYNKYFSKDNKLKK